MSHSSHTIPPDRKCSQRLAKKRKERLALTDQSKKESCCKGNNNTSLQKAILHDLGSGDDHDEKKMKSDDSKAFLNCLELKPVKSDIKDLCAPEFENSSAENEKIDSGNIIDMSYPGNPETSQISEGDRDKRQTSKSRTKKREHTKKKKKVVKINEKKDQKIYVIKNINDNTAAEMAKIMSADVDDNKEDSKIQMFDTPDSNELLNLANDSVKTDIKVTEDKKLEERSNQTKAKEADRSDSCQVYTFRDVNKKVAVNSDSSAQEETNCTTDLFAAVDLNRHGKKRRYDKLMKKLEDSEKTLQTNLKEVQLHEDDDLEKEDIDQCVEKIKEKLRVREKKKYEYLINYQRDQWRVDQKCFQDLLPEKVDLVKENIVRQLGIQNEKQVPEKRLRGRPRKTAPTQQDEQKKSDVKKQKAPRVRKKNVTQRKKSNAPTRGFPVKFPKCLLPDPNLAQIRQKFDKFRLGIIDKNGGQEIIELNCDTFKKMESRSDIAAEKAVTCAEERKDDEVDESCLEKDNGSAQLCDQKQLSSDVQGKERDRPENPLGYSANAKRHQPEKQMTCTTRPTVSKETSGINPPNALFKSPPTTIILPSISSLEREYELVSLSPSCSLGVGNLKTDQFFIPQSTFDQGGKTSMIMVGPFCMCFEPKPHLVLVSPEERKKGPTMILRKKIHSPSSTPPRDFRIHKDSRYPRLPDKASCQPKKGQQGDPATVSLDHDYMTPPEFRDNVKRYCKAVAKHSANARFIDARVEDITEGEDNVVVTIKGDNMLRQVKNLSDPLQAPMHSNEEGMPIVYNLSQIMTSALIRAEQMAKREEMVLESQKTCDYNPVMFPLSAMGDVVMEVLIPPGGTEFLPRSWAKHQLLCEEPVEPQTSAQSNISNKAGNGSQVKFLHCSTTINVDSAKINQPDTDKEEESEELVVIENEAAVKADPRPGLPCCRMCLRLFPSDYVLFTHVRSNHPTCETRDTMYLEELRARSRLACPVCCDPPVYLPTPPKLRRHLRQHHGIENYVETCQFCKSEFLDKHELELHMELSHNIYSHAFSPRGLVSLLKPHPTGPLMRGQRSLLSDYLSCSRCNMLFSDRASLLSHTLKMHPELNQFNICRLCDRVFDSGLALHKHLKKAHEQTHNGTLKCPFCPAWLPNMELASVHRASLHTGAVPVHCPFCGAGYQSLHPMYNHVRSQHLQTESHICPECQASFPTNRQLSEHARKIHLISPHIMKDSLHGPSNTTYCCPFCTVSFMRTYDLAVHVINAHRDRLLPVQCHMCMQSFVSDVTMKMHMSGAHGIEVHNMEDSSYMHRRYRDGKSVTVVLEDGTEEIFSHDDGLGNRGHGRGLVRRHIIDHQDMMETQDAGRYLQELDDRETETIVYLNDRNEVVNIPVDREHNTSEMFGNCSSMEDVQLLSEAGEEYNLQGVDYLETLSNDSIAVGADVVADVSMDQMANSRVMDRIQVNRSQDLMEMAGQFELDGVLYELAASPDVPVHHLRNGGDLITIDANNLRAAGDRLTIDANDLAHLLRQQVQ